MHILIIRLSSLGDVVLQTPMASWLKLKYPGCKISFLTANEFCPILQGHPHIDHVIGMERFRGKDSLVKLFQFGRNLKHKYKIDFILDLHSNTRSKLIRFFLPSVPALVVDKRKLERSLLVWFKFNFLKNAESIHSRNILDFQSIFGAKTNLDEIASSLQALNFNLKLTSIAETYQSNSSPLSNPYIVISAVASFDTKRWPVNNFAVLITKILATTSLRNFHIVILGGPGDDYLMPLSDIGPKERIHYQQGKTNLKESIIYLKHAALCVGNDTGLGHLAEAMGVPVITLFGPTSPDFGFGPHLEQSISLWSKEACSPCSTLGDKPCKFSVQYCMQNLSPELVLEKVEQVLVG